MKNGGGKKEKDPAWKYGSKGDVPKAGKNYVYLKCNFCSKTITGGVKRMKDHLAGTHENVAPCEKVPTEVKQEMQDYLKKFQKKKEWEHQAFNLMADRGGYYDLEGCGSVPGIRNSSGRSGVCGQSVEVNSRGIRGHPMDRYVTDDDSGGGARKEKGKLPPQTAKEHRNQVSLDIGRFFYENGISFNAAQSASFANMLRSVGAYGRGLKPPSMYELHTWILQQEMKTTDDMIEEVKKTWPKTGVTIMSDGWTHIKGRTILNFLVNNPEGTIFLKSVDVSDAIKDHVLLFNLLDKVVEEVGEEHVVQVVTDNASNYKKAGTKLMDKRRGLYWTPCVAYCLDLMLEKIGTLPQHVSALHKAKKVAKYIYNHGWVTALWRKFSKRELIRPATTRFATAYLSLQSMLQNKRALERKFASRRWGNSPWGNKPEGKAIKKIVMRDNNFWPSLVYALKSTKPLVSVLRRVDSKKEPAMGFLYGAIYQAKQEIAANFGDDLSQYKEIWDIIDEKWDSKLHKDLHAAGYYLNPQFHYDDNFSRSSDIKLGLFKCMEKLIRDPDEKERAHLELDEFTNAKGFFGLEQAIATRKKRTPANWWLAYGDDTPALKKFAVRVLSLTCSSSGCERNWSTFNQVHTKRRNQLDTVRMNALVYIMYNKKLKDKNIKRKTRSDEVDSLLAEMIDSDDEWLLDES